MITSEERRAIMTRIDAIDWDDAEVSWHFIDRLCRAMGLDSADTYKDGVRIIAGKIRELCEADGDAYQRGYDEGFASADDWYADRTDAELSSHGLMRLPKGADGVTVAPGQDVYSEDGRCWRVIGVGVGKYPVIAVPRRARTDEGEYKRLKPSWLRHKRDTPSTLADEIDAIADLGGGSRAVVSDEELHGIAERVRKLGMRKLGERP